jgi:hypothetical protein
MGSSGCRSNSSGRVGNGFVLSSDLSFQSYIRFAVGANGHKGAQLFFPLLEVYDPTGHLIYVGHDSKSNAALLKNLPQDLQSLQPIPGASQLPDVMKQLPDFESKAQDVLSSNRVTVLSVFLENCHACTVQEATLDDTQSRLRDLGINLLTIRVARTS